MAVADYTTAFPSRSRAELLERGQQRVHDLLRGLPRLDWQRQRQDRAARLRPPPSYSPTIRAASRAGIKVLLRDAPVGYFFEVVSKGYGAMPDYASQVPPRDRWAIIAYIRALQLSQHARLERTAGRGTAGRPEGPGGKTMSTAANPVTTQDWDRLQRRSADRRRRLASDPVPRCGALFSPAHFFRSYLVAFNFWLGIALGCLVILMLQYLTGGAWGILLRPRAGGRHADPAAAGPPLRAAPAGRCRYSTTGPGPRTSPSEPDLAFKSALPRTSRSSWRVRSSTSPSGWAVSYFLNRWSADRTRRRRPDRAARLRLLSGPGLVLYGLTITFASIDWVMSLEPHWFSTIYPVLFAVGQVLDGMAFAVAVSSCWRRARRCPD